MIRGPVTKMLAALTVALAVALSQHTVVATKKSDCAAVKEQCGGYNHDGPTCCEKGSRCVKHSKWFSQCHPDKQAKKMDKKRHHTHKKTKSLKEEARKLRRKARKLSRKAKTPEQEKKARQLARKADKLFKKARGNTRKGKAEKAKSKGKCMATWKQCGGSRWSGASCCEHSTDFCAVRNEGYYQCLPKDRYEDKYEEAVTEDTPEEDIPKQKGCAASYVKCGGKGHNGPTCCEHWEDACVERNEHWSWCQPVRKDKRIPIEEWMDMVRKSPEESPEPRDLSPEESPRDEMSPDDEAPAPENEDVE